MSYRDSDEARLQDLEKRLVELERREHPGFKERWRTRAEAFRAFSFPTLALAALASCVWGVGMTMRGCATAAEATRAGAATRCAAVCEAIGMRGSALEVSGSGEASNPNTACYCGSGTRLVTLHRDGTVTGVDTATGARFGDGP